MGGHSMLCPCADGISIVGAYRDTPVLDCPIKLDNDSK